MASLPHPTPSGTMSVKSAGPCERQVLREYFVVIGRALLPSPAPQDADVEALPNGRVGNQVPSVHEAILSRFDAGLRSLFHVSHSFASCSWHTESSSDGGIFIGRTIQLSFIKQKEIR